MQLKMMYHTILPYMIIHHGQWNTREGDDWTSHPLLPSLLQHQLLSNNRSTIYPLKDHMTITMVMMIALSYSQIKVMTLFSVTALQLKMLCLKKVKPLTSACLIFTFILDVTIVTSTTAVSAAVAASEQKVTRRTTKDTTTSHNTTVASSDNSSQHDSTLHISTPQRPIITDSAFPSDAS